MGFLTTVWSWIYHGSGFLVFYYAFVCGLRALKRTPMRKLKFIEKAVNNGNVTLGKVSSYIVYGRPLVHEVEYAYEVNGKVYFTTYILHNTDEEINLSDELQPGNGVACKVPSTVTVYYDPAKPQRTVLKGEVFSTRAHMKWQKTKKKNKYRDIYKDWTGPISL